MEAKKVNERIAMVMLRLCALVWEYCTIIDSNVTKAELTFAEVWNGTSSDVKMWKKCPISMICLKIWEIDDVFINRVQAIEGVRSFDDEKMVTLFVTTDDNNPQRGFSCSYHIRDAFNVVRSFCKMNDCQKLISKMTFGVDGNGKWTRLPEVKDTSTKTASKPQINVHLTLAERLREALRKQTNLAA